MKSLTRGQRSSQADRNISNQSEGAAENVRSFHELLRLADSLPKALN